MFRVINPVCKNRGGIWNDIIFCNRIFLGEKRLMQISFLSRSSVNTSMDVEKLQKRAMWRQGNEFSHFICERGVVTKFFVCSFICKRRHKYRFNYNIKTNSYTLWTKNTPFRLIYKPHYLSTLSFDRRVVTSVYYINVAHLFKTQYKFSHFFTKIC